MFSNLGLWFMIKIHKNGVYFQNLHLKNLTRELVFIEIKTFPKSKFINLNLIQLKIC